jgi:hypothetical protein
MTRETAEKSHDKRKNGKRSGVDCAACNREHEGREFHRLCKRLSYVLDRKRFGDIEICRLAFPGEIKPRKRRQLSIV